MIIMYPTCCHIISITSPQKPYVALNVSVCPTDARIPLKISCQIYPRIMPPIKFGIKNTVLNVFVPRNPFVSSSATANASTLISTTVTNANAAVNQRE